MSEDSAQESLQFTYRSLGYRLSDDLRGAIRWMRRRLDNIERDLNDGQSPGGEQGVATERLLIAVGRWDKFLTVAKDAGVDVKDLLGFQKKLRESGLTDAVMVNSPQASEAMAKWEQRAARMTAWENVTLGEVYELFQETPVTIVRSDDPDSCGYVVQVDGKAVGEAPNLKGVLAIIGDLVCERPE